MADENDDVTCLACGLEMLHGIDSTVNALERETMRSTELWVCSCGRLEERPMPSTPTAAGVALERRIRDAVPAFYAITVTSDGPLLHIGARPPDDTPSFMLSTRRRDDDAVMSCVTDWIAGKPWDWTREIWPDSPQTWTTPPPNAA